MKEKIKEITRQIQEKKDRLKEKAERCLDSIKTPSSTAINTSAKTTKSKVPPISYILYGITGITTLCAISTDSKLLCTGIAVASAFGGYKLSQTGRSSNDNTINYSSSLPSIKTAVTSKVIDAVKKTSKEWEEFMEANQKEIQTLIETSSIDTSKKDEMMSKIFVYEVFDISVSEFSNMINSVNSSLEIKQKINAYKIKLLDAIDNAANKQISKYNSLLV